MDSVNPRLELGIPTWSNQTIWTGDHIEIIRSVNSASVNLIYLELPFNPEGQLCRAHRLD